jgi:hypothetical protein
MMADENFLCFYDPYYSGRGDANQLRRWKAPKSGSEAQQQCQVPVSVVLRVQATLELCSKPQKLSLVKVR